MIDNSKEYILCAAIRRNKPLTANPYWKGTNDICNIEIGYRHHDIFQRFNSQKESTVSIKMEDQGFYTSRGRFVDRFEGMKLAYEAGQVNKELAFRGDEFAPLFSEQLY